MATFREELLASVGCGHAALRTETPEGEKFSLSIERPESPAGQKVWDAAFVKGTLQEAIVGLLCNMGKASVLYSLRSPKGVVGELAATLGGNANAEKLGRFLASRYGYTVPDASPAPRGKKGGADSSAAA